MLTSAEVRGPAFWGAATIPWYLRGMLTPEHWISGIGIKAPLPHKLGKKAEVLSFPRKNVNYSLAWAWTWATTGNY